MGADQSKSICFENGTKIKLPVCKHTEYGNFMSSDCIKNCDSAIKVRESILHLIKGVGIEMCNDKIVNNCILDITIDDFYLYNVVDKVPIIDKKSIHSSRNNIVEYLASVNDFVDIRKGQPDVDIEYGKLKDNRFKLINNIRANDIEIRKINEEIEDNKSIYVFNKFNLPINAQSYLSIPEHIRNMFDYLITFQMEKNKGRMSSVVNSINQFRLFINKNGTDETKDYIKRIETDLGHTLEEYAELLANFNKKLDDINTLAELEKLNDSFQIEKYNPIQFMKQIYNLSISDKKLAKMFNLDKYRISFLIDNAVQLLERHSSISQKNDMYEHEYDKVMLKLSVVSDDIPVERFEYVANMLLQRIAIKCKDCKLFVGQMSATYELNKIIDMKGFGIGIKGDSDGFMFTIVDHPLYGYLAKVYILCEYKIMTINMLDDINKLFNMISTFKKSHVGIYLLRDHTTNMYHFKGDVVKSGEKSINMNKIIMNSESFSNFDQSDYSTYYDKILYIIGADPKCQRKGKILSPTTNQTKSIISKYNVFVSRNDSGYPIDNLKYDTVSTIRHVIIKNHEDNIIKLEQYKTLITKGLGIIGISIKNCNGVTQKTYDDLVELERTIGIGNGQFGGYIKNNRRYYLSDK